MGRKHVGLIIEDDQEMAEELGDLLRSFGHDHVYARTKTEALAFLAKRGLCYVLADLQIRADHRSIKPRIESGMSLLEEIRKRFPGRNGSDKHLLPVIVVSEQVTETDDVVRAMQKGADDVVRNPLAAERMRLEDRIKKCLAESGRHSHHDCDVVQQQAAGSGAGQTGPRLQHTEDYSEVFLDDEFYLFNGDIQRKVIRILHEAVKRGCPWQSGKAVLTEAGSKSTKMSNLLGHHPCWGTLVLSDRRGKYRLNTE